MFYKKQKINLLTYFFIGSISFVWFLLVAFSVSSSALDVPTATADALANKIIEEAEETEPSKIRKKALIDEPLVFEDVIYGTFYDIDVSNEFILKLDNYIDRLKNALATGDYSKQANNIMSTELTRLQDIKTAVAADVAKYVTWENEYYYATKVWEYFMQRGYSETVTSAIIGNMMVETAGGTLNLNPDAYSPSGNYYGLCQWSTYYYPGAKDLPFEHQLDYLIGDMPYQFNTFGKCYKSGFDYEDFLAMTDPAEAALAFAKSYERCKPAYYGLREEAAMVAYNYFNLNS